MWKSPSAEQKSTFAFFLEKIRDIAQNETHPMIENGNHSKIINENHPMI